MVNLNQNYISNQLRLSDTDTVVIVNGKYQSRLSMVKNTLIKLTEQTLVISQNSKTLVPLHLLFITSDSYQEEFNIIAEKNSQATIIEEHLNFGEEPSVGIINLNLAIEEDAQIDHYKIQARILGQLEYQTNTAVNLSWNSKFASSFINYGGKRSINHLQVKFAGDNASYDYQGVDILQDQQEMEHRIVVEHLSPNCNSNILSKSIINDQADCSFSCKAIVYPGAFQTVTHVTNKNLLLSDAATVNSQPELEVYADEVICTHGATSGQLDQEALFYLRSRGLSEKRAVQFLTAAFVEEIVAKFPQYTRFKIMNDLTNV